MFTIPKSSFFAEISTGDLTKNQKDYLNFQMNHIVSVRFSNFVVASKHINSIISPCLQGQLLLPSTSDQTQVISLAKKFAQSSHLQEVYVKQFGTYIEPTDLIVNNIKVGHQIDLATLSSLILENSSILESIIAEKANLQQIINKKFTIFDSDLTCSKERLKRLVGKLRFELGADDFTLDNNPKQKYLGVYVTFLNIPLKHRLKRKEIYLLSITSRTLMNSANATAIDVIHQLVSKFKQLETNGVEVVYQNTNGATLSENVQVVLSAISCDNLGKIN